MGCLGLEPKLGYSGEKTSFFIDLVAVIMYFSQIVAPVEMPWHQPIQPALPAASMLTRWIAPK
jgi:hypothetical protein